MLTIPQLPELALGFSVHSLAEDVEVVQNFEKLVTVWEQQIVDALRAFISKVHNNEYLLCQNSSTIKNTNTMMSIY